MTILGFFAASVANGKVIIWIVFLIHCLVMAIGFRPQTDQHDSDSSTNEAFWSKFFSWGRKLLLAVFLVFIQIFTFIPFNESKRNTNKPEANAQETSQKTPIYYEDASLRCFYLVRTKLVEHLQLLVECIINVIFPVNFEFWQSND